MFSTSLNFNPQAQQQQLHQSQFPTFQNNNNEGSSFSFLSPSPFLLPASMESFAASQPPPPLLPLPPIQQQQAQLLSLLLQSTDLVNLFLAQGLQLNFNPILDFPFVTSSSSSSSNQSNNNANANDFSFNPDEKDLILSMEMGTEVASNADRVKLSEETVVQDQHGRIVLRSPTLQFVSDPVQGERPSPLQSVDLSNLWNTSSSSSSSSPIPSSNPATPLVSSSISSGTSSNASGKQRKMRKKKLLFCSNCGVTSSNTWRKGDSGNRLCNRCGLFWRRHRKNPIIKPAATNTLGEN